MNFLADQDVYATTVRFLRDLGHDVVPVGQIGLSRSEDTDLLKVAEAQGRILIIRDRDFGGLVFVEHAGRGVLYLRILPSTQDAVHAELKRVLSTYEAEELLGAVLVVEPGRHRFRKLDE